jgi:hypothetical protein
MVIQGDEQSNQAEERKAETERNDTRTEVRKHRFVANIPTPLTWQRYKAGHRRSNCDADTDLERYTQYSLAAIGERLEHHSDHLVHKKSRRQVR